MQTTLEETHPSLPKIPLSYTSLLAPQCEFSVVPCDSLRSQKLLDAHRRVEATVATAFDAPVRKGGFIVNRHGVDVNGAGGGNVQHALVGEGSPTVIITRLGGVGEEMVEDQTDGIMQRREPTRIRFAWPPGGPKPSSW